MLDPRSHERIPSDTTPMAVEHHDGLEPAPACERCGEPKQLVMLERFTGWWCPVCASPVNMQNQ